VTPRFRFGAFTVSPARRLLLRGAEPVPLIPRYFDLLVLLLERRQQALHRREIRDAVWGDVVVSDGALSQAVRTLRRALGDDPREPSFIRTVSRHGYRFVHEGVAEEPDDSPLAAAEPPPAASDGDRFETALATLLAPGASTDGDGEHDERRAAAEALHALGTAETLRRLDRRPGHARARCCATRAGTCRGPARSPCSGLPAACRPPARSPRCACGGPCAWPGAAGPRRPRAAHWRGPLRDSSAAPRSPWPGTPPAGGARPWRWP
jgi:DNA-binding winged helix-turn-helix (wHTH) protein